MTVLWCTNILYLLLLAAFGKPAISPLQVSIYSGSQLNINCSTKKFDSSAILLYEVLVNGSSINETTDPKTLTEYTINPATSKNTGSYTCKTSLTSNRNISRVSDQSAYVSGKNYLNWLNSDVPILYDGNIGFNRFHSTGLFQYPLGIEWDQWHEIGWMVPLWLFISSY